MALDATPGGENANSYVTLAQASAYHATHLYASAWTAASSATQETAVIMATRTLDDWVDWKGNKQDDDQALRWPRYGVEDRDGYDFEIDEIPVFLINATSELARTLIGGDVTAEPDTKGFSKLKVGSLELVVDKEDRDSTTVLPDTVKAMVEHYGRIRSRNGPTEALLMRS